MNLIDPSSLILTLRVLATLTMPLESLGTTASMIRVKSLRVRS